MGERQTEVLGSGERNHRAYVKRAAEAVRDGLANLLELRLNDMKELAESSAVKNRPAYFQRVWDGELDAQEAAAKTARLEELTGKTDAPASSFGAVAAEQDAVVSTRDRLVADAKSKGLLVPAHIARGTAAEVGAWYDANVLSRPEP